MMEVDPKQGLVCDMCKTRSGHLDNSWCILCNYIYAPEEEVEIINNGEVIELIKAERGVVKG